MNRMQPEARILGGVCSIGKPPWNGPRLPFRRCMYSCLKLESTIENVRREKLRTKSKTQGPNGGLDSTQSRKGRMNVQLLLPADSIAVLKMVHIVRVVTTPFISIVAVAHYFSIRDKSIEALRENIPAEFARANGLQAETSMILRVRSGKSWPVKLSSRKNSASTLKRTSITKGWEEFYASNKLKEGDVCHFELRPRATRSNTTIVLDVRRLASRFGRHQRFVHLDSWPVSRRFRYPMLMLGSPAVRGLNYEVSEKACSWLIGLKFKS
ncbi:hypothetical protein RJ640_020337 [Escallonia rubra]|uniref:TF-B3 domain-containing protein n=1 Tax=Escallonia rubra TaxID=112253 RepID=A0AA88QF65_9ASTE|nr:hypothetical protein RJ640_020337 [Escallonia rubra]